MVDLKIFGNGHDWNKGSEEHLSDWSYTYTSHLLEEEVTGYHYSLHGNPAVHLIGITRQENLGLSVRISHDHWMTVDLRTPFLVKWLPTQNPIWIGGMIRHDKLGTVYTLIKALYWMDAKRFEYKYDHNFIGKEDTAQVSGHSKLISIYTRRWSPFEEMLKGLKDEQRPTTE